MNIVVRSGGLRNAPKREYREKSILLDVTHADPQAPLHLRGDSADQHGSVISTSEARKRQHYARPGHVSFDERSNKIATLAVESLGRFGGEDSAFIDQWAASVVGGRDGESMAGKEVVKERLLQIVSVFSSSTLIWRSPPPMMSPLSRSWTRLAEALTCSFLSHMWQGGASTKLSRISRREISM